MNPHQAIQLLALAAKQAKLSFEDHLKVQDAIEVLNKQQEEILKAAKSQEVAKELPKALQ